MLPAASTAVSGLLPYWAPRHFLQEEQSPQSHSYLYLVTFFWGTGSFRVHSPTQTVSLIADLLVEMREGEVEGESLQPQRLLPF